MAGDWIKMRTNLDTDPAVVRISSALEADRFSVVGRLHKIWAWANEHLTDGQNVPVDAAFLDELVASPGFAAAMRDAGWLSGRDGCLCFPGFERHNGESAKRRAQDAARKNEVRASAKRPQNVRTPSGQNADQRREEKTISRRRLQDLEFVAGLAAPAAKRILLTRRAGISKELAWQAACLLTSIDEDEVGNLCAKLTGGTVESPGRYIGGVCKHICRERGLDWSEVKQKMPPCPRPAEANGAA